MFVSPQLDFVEAKAFLDMNIFNDRNVSFVRVCVQFRTKEYEK